jgi:hypothetical protein
VRLMHLFPDGQTYQAIARDEACTRHTEMPNGFASRLENPSPPLA